MKYIAIAAAALLVSSPILAQTSRAVVQRLEDRWVSAISRSDIPSLTAMYEKDAWLVLPGAPPAKGRAAIAETLRTLARSVKSMKLQSLSIVPLGRNAMVENGVASLMLGEDQQIRSSNYQVVWHRTPDGRWQIVRDMVSSR